MRVDMDCYKCKKVALHSVAGMDGIDKISINMRERTLTVVGDADPICIVNQIRKKFRCATLLPPPPPPPPSEPAKPEPESEPKPEPQSDPKPEPQSDPKPEPNPEPKPEPEPAPAPAPPTPTPPPPTVEIHREIIYFPQCPHCMGHTPSFAPQEYCGCSEYSSKTDIPWPAYRLPTALPDEVFYVQRNEDNQSWCTIC